MASPLSRSSGPIPRRLAVAPTDRPYILVHPGNQTLARKVAAEQGLDAWVTSPLVPVLDVLMVDPTQVDDFSYRFTEGTDDAP